MPVHLERRKKPRDRPPSLVYVELESANGGMMRDLSDVGFAVRVVVPLRAGEKTQFAFSLDDATHVSGEGRIVWVEENGRVAGLEFLGLSATARRQILEWLARPEEFTQEPSSPQPPKEKVPSLDDLRHIARTGAMSKTLSKPNPAEPDIGRMGVMPRPLPKPDPAEPDITRTGGLPRILPKPDPVEPDIGRTGAMSRIRPKPDPAEPDIARTGTMFRALHKQDPVDPHIGQTGAMPRTLPKPDPVGPPSIQPAAKFAEVTKPAPIPELRTDVPEDEVFRLSALDLPISTARAAPPHFVEVPESPKTERIAFKAFPEPEPPWRRQAAILEPLPGVYEGSSAPAAAHGRSSQRFTLSWAIRAMLILTIVVAAVAFRRPVGQALVWLGEGIGGPGTTETSQTPANPSSSPNTLSPSSGPAARGSPAKSVTAAREARKHNPSSPATNKNKAAETPPATGGTLSASAKDSTQPVLAPMAEVSKTTAPTGTSEPPTEAAATEYTQALQILDNPNRQRELPEAARLLWVAVEKGNSSAEVALAELYRKGKGVTRNCDQARVLLTAAARKGNTEAQKHLRQLLRGGCE